MLVLKKKYKKKNKSFKSRIAKVRKRSFVNLVNSPKLFTYRSHLGPTRFFRNVLIETYSLFYRHKNLIINTNLTSATLRKVLFVILKIYARTFFKVKRYLYSFKQKSNYLFQDMLYSRTNLRKIFKFSLLKHRIWRKRKVSLKKTKKILQFRLKRSKNALFWQDKSYKIKRLCIVNEMDKDFSQEEKWFKKNGSKFGIDYRYTWMKGFLTNRPRKVWKRKAVVYEKFPNLIVVIASARYQDIANEARKKNIPSIGLVTADMEPVFTYNIVIGGLNKEFVVFFFQLLIQTIKLANFYNRSMLKYLKFNLIPKFKFQKRVYDKPRFWKSKSYKKFKKINYKNQNKIFKK